MKFMSRRNGGDSVNNESAGRVVYRINTIPEFYLFSIYYVPLPFFNDLLTKRKKKIKRFKQNCVRIRQPITGRRVTVRTTSSNGYVTSKPQISIEINAK